MVKKIIVRFVSGFLLLLAMVLMDKYFSTGLIFTNVNAKSCGYSGTKNNTVLNDIASGKLSYTQYTNTDYGRMITVIYNLTSSDHPNISLDGHDYYVLHVPSAFIMSYVQADSNGDTTAETLQVMGLLCTQSNGCYNADIESGGMYFKIDSNIKVTSIRFRVVTMNWQFNSQGELAWLGNIWSQDFYDCSDDDALLQEQEKTNDLLEDDSIDTNKTDSDINNMNSKVASNNSITQLLTLPITLYQSILNATSGSCSSISLGSLYGHSLSLPCINLSNLLGSTLYNIIDILCSGLFILAFRKKMVDIFNHMTSLNDRGNELE